MLIEEGMDPRRHLQMILADQDPVSITRGELEKLRCLRREVWHLKALVETAAPGAVLVTGEALQALFDLV